MKAIKSVIALLLAACAVLLLANALGTANDLPALLERLDPGNQAAAIPRMLTAKERVTTALSEGSRAKILRALERYTDSFQEQLELSGENGLKLFFYRHSPSVIAVSILLLVVAATLLAGLVPGLSRLRKGLIYLCLTAVLYVGIYVLENTVGSSTMLMTVLKKGAIYALIAVSMNLLNGFTGLFSLGQAGFMLIGAYTYAIFTIAQESRAQVYQYYAGGLVQFTLPPVVAIVLAGLAAAFFAYLIGQPVLRLKSDYLAIATLGFAEIIRAIFQYDGLGPITNGSNLLRKFTTFDSAIFPFAVVGICITLIALLIHSTYGRAFKAIRDDEVAAEAMGINLFHHKQMSFVISSFFAGVGGALLAMYQTTVQASAFKSSMTYEILLIVVIGGMGSLTGSVLASFLFIASSEWWLRFLDNELVLGGVQIPLLRSGFRMVVFSVIIMAVVLFYRRGIMGDKEFTLRSFLKGLPGGKEGGRRG